MKKTTLTKIIFIIDVFVAICFFVFYGPFSYVRNTLIATAMDTKTHQYIAYTFYNSKTIDKVLQMGTQLPFSSVIDLSKIVINTAPKDEYDNAYDEAILTREAGNENYKRLDIKIAGYKAYLVAIYDPSKIELATSKVFNTNKNGEKMLAMCERLGGIVCINGGGFQDPDGWGSDIPMGYLIKDGKIIWSDTSVSQSLIGFNKDHKLTLINATGEEAIAQGMRDALQFGPYLIVNGESIKFADSAGGYSRAARVAIAQRRDGVVLFLVTEGTHTAGPKISEVAATLALYGAYNAANLDGGTSSQLVINNKLINTPRNIYNNVVVGGRSVVSGFILMP